MLVAITVHVDSSWFGTHRFANWLAAVEWLERTNCSTGTEPAPVPAPVRQPDEPPVEPQRTATGAALDGRGYWKEIKNDPGLLKRIQSIGKAKGFGWQVVTWDVAQVADVIAELGK